MNSDPNATKKQARHVDKYLIGLTGNIATGKSAVAQMLAELGAQPIDADQIAHHLMRHGAPTWQTIVNTFGPAILAPSGEIDRQQLSKIVFTDPAALRRLETIVHPAAIQAITAAIAATTERIVVVEAIKLIEAGMHRAYHTLWVTTCPKETQIARLVALRGLSQTEARQRIEAQPSQAKKIALANVIIDTGSTLDDTHRQVLAAWKTIPPGSIK